jgi:hypothetical protein
MDDINRRYRTENAIVEMNVLSRASSMPLEYIDSAPMQGLAHVGVVGARQYANDKDHVYINRFVLVTPKR